MIEKSPNSNFIETEDCKISNEQKSNHSEQVKDNLRIRLNRIEGQIRGIKRLIEKDTYCDDVIDQITAIHGALNGVSKILLENQLKTNVYNSVQEGNVEILDEILITMEKLMRR